jgi:hypothetical protein
MNQTLVVDDEPSVLQGLAFGFSSEDNVLDLAIAWNAVIMEGDQSRFGKSKLLSLDGRDRGMVKRGTFRMGTSCEIR